MACCLIGTNPLAEQMLTYCQLGPYKQISVKFLIKTETFSLQKTYLKMLSAKWWPFCSGLNVLTHISFESDDTYRPKKINLKKKGID